MIRTPFRSPLPTLVLVATSAVAVVLTAVALTTPAQARPGQATVATTAAAPSCGITWGSAAKHGATNGPVQGALLTNVRAGRNACFDRLLLDVRGTTALTSWRVEYVPQVIEDPSGRPVPLRGGAYLQIAVGASDHTDSDVPTYSPPNRRELADVRGFTTFRQVAWAGSFEGISSVGLGVRAHLPFRVFTMTGIPGSANGTRVVIDVAHRW